jgi:hypothetical protein
MAAGDILFYGNPDIGTTLINWRTHGLYSHCCVEVENNAVIEAKWPNVSLDVRGNPDAVYTPVVDPTKLPEALAWLHTTIGDKYDVMDIVANGFGFLLPHKKVFAVPTMFICSELTVWFLIKAGYQFPSTFQKDEDSIDLVSPNELARILGIL